MILEEMETLQASGQHKLKKEKKKEREVASKTRKRHEIGMSNNSFEETHDMELFSMTNTMALLKKGANKASTTDTATTPTHHTGDNSDDDEEEEEEQDEWFGGHRGPLTAEEEEEAENEGFDDDYLDLSPEAPLTTGGDRSGRMMRVVEIDEDDELDALEEELEYDYKRFVAKKKERDILQEEADLRDKKLQKKKRRLAEENQEAFESEMAGNEPDLEIDHDDIPATATMFLDQDKKGKKLPTAKANVAKSKSRELEKRLATKHTDEWFSNPIFKDADNVNLSNKLSIADDDDDEEEVINKEEYDFDYEQDGPTTKTESAPITNTAKPSKNQQKGTKRKSERDAESEVLPDMPKTDKQVRKEKRKKDQERQLRKQSRRAERDAPAGDDEDENSIRLKRPPTTTAGGGSTNIESKVLTEGDLKHMRLIEKGMGKQASREALIQEERAGFEIVPREADAVVEGDDQDMRQYYRAHQGTNDDGDSTDDDKSEASQDLTQEYIERGKKNRLTASAKAVTAENRVMSLALGTLMLSTSRKKALIDSSYNRYAWNDNEELPSWFTEDETRHNKPQIPVPAALLDQVRLCAGLYVNIYTLYMCYICTIIYTISSCMCTYDCICVCVHATV